MSTHEPRCPALHPDLPYSRCALDERHVGTHRNFAGNEWADAPDLMDGGVTCAAIENETDEKPTAYWEGIYRGLRDDADNARTMAALWKETARRAIQTPVTLARWEKDLLIEDFKSNGPVYTTGERDRHRAQIERAERALADVHERDETVARLEARLIEAEQELDDARHDVNAYSSALSRVRAALGLADDASTDDMVERAEAHDCIRDAAVIEKTRGLTPEQEEQIRLGKIVRDVQNGDGWGVEIGGVKIAPCDTYGRTEDERAAAALTADDVTDAMADRFLDAFSRCRGTLRDALRAGIEAMSTPEPQRPEGAEDIKPEIQSWLRSATGGVGALTPERVERLADFLAERGVRVVTEEQP